MRGLRFGCQRQAPLAYFGWPAAIQNQPMRKPRQTTLEIPVPKAPGRLRAARRKRMRTASLRKSLLMDFESFMQMTQGAVDAAAAASKQGNLNLG